MTSKLLETKIRRHQLFAAFDEGRAVNCPICLVSPGAPAVPGHPPLPAVEGRSTLLLVSDDAGLGVRLSNTANLAGLAYMQINDPANAIRLAVPDCPSVVFLDLDLPALAGWEVVERFLEDERWPSLVLLTGRTHDFGLGAAIHAGTIVDKSASLARLLKTVDGILTEAAAEREDRRARQRLLVRRLRPCDWTVPVTSGNRHWGINE
jgi:DNA-binding response OmpR family regulator